MTLEVCIDSYKGAELARRFGAKRVELCSALSVGGLTPSIGLVAECAEVAEVHAMLRHREGDFVYSPREIEIMLDDIDFLANAGASGVVFGCLTENKAIDLNANAELIKEAKILGLETTFHRAFDFSKNPKESLNKLIDLGFDRLLTSGQKPRAIDGIDLISDLVAWANGRMEIMAGSGVNATNALMLANVGVDALHFTSHISQETKDSFGMGLKTISDTNKIKSIAKLF
ncbi:copper homeostasis protein CutC [Cryomorphaceae bacterium 1068]|nr:copper homeostasis protein CutC [Cryomorphaceae bacterium 1068]